ncbi:MAG: acyl carrier protein [Brevinematia bacterium]
MQISEKDIMEIKNIIAEILKISPADISENTHFVEDLKADSLSLLEILFEIEKKFNINFPPEETSGLLTISKIREYLENFQG